MHQDCADGAPVRLALKLDRSGQAVMIALPERNTPNMEDDKTLRETSCDPKFRRALITDGKSAVGLAVARALLDAGCPMVFLGDPQTWRRDPAYDALAADGRVQTLALDVTDTDSVDRAAASIGGKVEILVNTADLEREGGLMQRKDVNTARDALDVNVLGMMRLAQAFGPGLRARADGVNSAAAWVNVLSIYAHMNLPARGMWSASKAAALSLAQCLRAEMRGAGVRVLNVFPGPLDHEWEQRTPPPRVAPATVAAAIVKALRDGVEDVYVGDVAQEFPRPHGREPQGTGARAGRLTPGHAPNASRPARDRAANNKETQHEPEHPRPIHDRTGLRPHPAGGPDRDADAGIPHHRAAAGIRPGLAVPHRGDLALRRARPGLVLEQLLLLRAHRHALRRAGALDHRQGPARQHGRHDSGGGLHRQRLRDRLFGRGARQPDFLLTIDFVKQWEAKHGRIPARSWVLMRTDWSKRAKPAEYLNMKEDGAHSPGPTRMWCPG